jgi:hypothetical protein
MSWFWVSFAERNTPTVRKVNDASHFVFYFSLKLIQERQELSDLGSVMLGYEKEPQSMQ